MLPAQTKLRWLLYDAAAENKAIVHFIFENIICETSKDFRNIEELIICRNEIQREAGIAEKMKKTWGEVMIKTTDFLKKDNSSFRVFFMRMCCNTQKKGSWRFRR